MTGPAFETFVAPARARPAVWRLVLGLLLGAVVYFMIIAAAVAVIGRATGGETALLALQSGDILTYPATTLILLFSFFGMGAGAVVAARALHRRGLASLIGPLRPALRDFVVAAGVTFALFLPGVFLWTLGFQPQPNLAPGFWLMLLPLIVLALLIQTGAEELVFRGYLMQQLAARFTLRVIWFWLPALVFGAIHYDPASAGDSAWLLILSPMLFGILAADLTVRRGNLGAAWGFHFANNFVAIAVLSTQGTITGLSLWLTPYAAEDLMDETPLIVSDFALLLLAWWVLRKVLARYP